MLQSADLVPGPRDTTAERQRNSLTPSRLLGGALLALIYAVAVYASRGLFDPSATDAPHAATMAVGILNVAILPLLILGMVAGTRRMWLDGTPNPHLARLLMAPLWAAFILALLTVPLWMGLANAHRYASATAVPSYSATLLLAPWGFLLAYGFALVITGAMFDFTYPVAVSANTPSSIVGRG